MYDNLKKAFLEHDWKNVNVNEKILLGCIIWELSGNRADIYNVKFTYNEDGYICLNKFKIIYPKLGLSKDIPVCLISDFVYRKNESKNGDLLDKEYFLKQIFEEICLKIFKRRLRLASP
jgi:hypothetical protein